METKYLETVLSEHSSDMSGKTVIITGTTSGTGYVAAREVANLGADVLLLNRDSERASRSFLELKQQIKAGSLKAIMRSAKFQKCSQGMRRHSEKLQMYRRHLHECWRHGH